METTKFNLAEGSILKKLLLVALPIMGTQIIQMTYNLTDMFWLGRVGSNAVAASGTVGMYVWLSMAFLMFGRMGAEIGVSQNLGQGDAERAKGYAQASLALNTGLGLIYGILLILLAVPLVAFFQIQDTDVVLGAQQYLRIIGIGIPFSFISAAVTGIFNGSGNSRLPFAINCLGLVINMVLDPLFILTMEMGIEGAALATILAQAVACVCSLLALARSKSRPFEHFHFLKKPALQKLKQIFIWAAPIAAQTFLFAFLSMFLSRMVAAYGSDAMAAQRIGSQVESLAWLIGGGFSSALTAFIGQNYGAGKWSRIHKSFRISSIAMVIWGTVISLVLYFGGGLLYTIFLPNDPGVVEIGANYLRILALCEMVGCLESVAQGAFNGMGKTIPPAVASIVANALRLVAAYFLTQTSLGLDGIWWAISMGALLRGAWMYIWYLIQKRKLPKQDVQSTCEVALEYDTIS